MLIKASDKEATYQNDTFPTDSRHSGSGTLKFSIFTKILHVASYKVSENVAAMLAYKRPSGEVPSQSKALNRKATRSFPEPSHPMQATGVARPRCRPVRMAIYSPRRSAAAFARTGVQLAKMLARHSRPTCVPRWPSLGNAECYFVD